MDVRRDSPSSRLAVAIAFLVAAVPIALVLWALAS
jgi:hypothetical protein